MANDDALMEKKSCMLFMLRNKVNKYIMTLEIFEIRKSKFILASAKHDVSKAPIWRSR